MFSLLVDLGKTFIRRDRITSSSELILDSIGDAYSCALIFVVNKEGEYRGVEWREISSSERNKLPYKKPSGSRSRYLTPVNLMTGKPKEMMQRFAKYLEVLIEWHRDKNLFDEVEILGKLLDCLLSKGEAIGTELIQLGTEIGLNADKRGVFYPKIDGYTPEELYKWPSVQEHFKELILEKYGSSGASGIPLVANDKVCSVCGQLKEIVVGNFSEYKVYSLDQPGRITGGFHPSSAIKNFPVCVDCAIVASYALNRSLQQLSFRMGGLRYLAIPCTEHADVRLEFLDHLLESDEKEVRERLERMGSLSVEEKDVLAYAADLGNKLTLSLRLVFYRIDNARQEILAEIDEVLPSRLHHVFQVKEIVEKEIGFTERLREQFKNRLNFGMMQTFVNKEGKGHTPLLALIESILKGGSMERSEAIRSVMDQILIAQRKSGGMQSQFTVLEGYLFLEFLRRLEVITWLEKGGTIVEPSSPFQRFMAERPEFFVNAACRVAFLTGALVQSTAYIQARERGLMVDDAPLLKKLRGFRLDERNLKELLGEAKEKLIAYKANGWSDMRDLQDVLSKEWVETSGSWPLSSDETTFFFVLGMNLTPHIRAMRNLEKAESTN